MPDPSNLPDEMTTLDLIERCVELAASPQQLAGTRLTAKLLRECRAPADAEQAARAVEFALATLLLVLSEDDYERFCKELSANAIKGVGVFKGLISQALKTGHGPVLESIDEMKRLLHQTRH